MNKRIQFVIPTYEPERKVLNDLLRSLGDVLMFIVDNSESEFRLDRVAGNQQIIKNNKNLGYSGSVTVGVRKALSQNADWVVIVNQDLHVIHKSIDKLLDTLSHHECGIVGLFSGKFDEKRGTTILPSRHVDYISGSCIAIHRSVFEKVGYFYEPYFMYYEDADFCVRAKKAGFPLIHLPIAGITHHDTTSLGRGSFLHQYYLARNHLLFVERNAPLSVKIHEIVRIPKTVWEHWRKGETGALIGIRDYLFRRFGQY